MPAILDTIWFYGMSMDLEELLKRRNMIMEYVLKESTPESYFVLSAYIYHLATIYIASGELELLEYTLNEGISRLEKVADRFENCRIYAMLSMFYQLKIASTRNMFKVIYYSNKARNYLKKAEGIAPNDPIVKLTKAIMLYHTPSQFGGDKEKSIEILKRILENYDGWGRDLAYIYLAQNLHDRGEKQKAISVLEECLKEFPESAWALHLLSKYKKEK